MSELKNDRFLRSLARQPVDVTPVWMMRQAGRHLPEYRETRAKARDFLDFCYTTALAAEATLQPVRRYYMDGAILFADILLVLDAMGRNVRFLEGEGPRVDTATKAKDLAGVPMDKLLSRLGLADSVTDATRKRKAGAVVVDGKLFGPDDLRWKPEPGVYRINVGKRWKQVKVPALN